MEIDKLLPIGSIVRLKDTDKHLMIFGIKQSAQTDDGDVTTDYIGVLYPEGNMGIKHQYFFDHDRIDQVVFRGFEDGERDSFIETLSNIYAKQREA